MKKSLLREEGCQEVQSHLLSRPLTPADLKAFLRERMASVGKAVGTML